MQSSLLFTLTIETLAIAVQLNNDIKGIQILVTSHKLALYADNVGFSLSNPVQLLPAVSRYHSLPPFQDITSMNPNLYVFPQKSEQFLVL